VPFIIHFATKKGEKVVAGVKKAVKKDIKGGKPIVMNENEREFLESVKKEVALRRYDVYEDYAEMVAQVSVDDESS
jgi:glycerol-3-phosphate cytidylyltransferase-like family protein